MAALQVSSSPSMVYVSSHLPKTWQEVRDDYQSPKLAAYEKIGRIYARAVAILREGTLENQKPEFFQLLQLLGTDDRGQQSIQTALELFRKLFHLQASLPTAYGETMGVYYLSTPESTPEFVFKIGAKRAATELLAAKQADLMGLSSHVVSGLYCVLTNPPKDLQLVEELWNGNDKKYLEQPPYSVGIIERFLDDSQSDDPLLSYSQMLLVALAIGLRDGKLDGVKKDAHILFDVDDCYAPIIDPPFFQNWEELKAKGVAATDLPLLKDPLAATPLNADQIATLAAIVNAWDIVSLSQKLRGEPIRYADQIVEKHKRGNDETGTAFTYEKGKEHLIRGDLKVDIAKQTAILSEAQQIAIITRMGRLKQFIIDKFNNNETCTPLDIVFAVDPFLKLYREELEKMEQRVGRELLRRRTPTDLLGRNSPYSLSSSFEWPEGQVDTFASRLFASSKLLRATSITSSEAKEGEVDQDGIDLAAFSDAEAERELNQLTKEEESSEVSSQENDESGSDLDADIKNQLAELSVGRTNFDPFDFGT